MKNSFDLLKQASDFEVLEIGDLEPPFAIMTNTQETGVPIMVYAMSTEWELQIIETENGFEMWYEC